VQVIWQECADFPLFLPNLAAGEFPLHDRFKPASIHGKFSFTEKLRGGIPLPFWQSDGSGALRGGHHPLQERRFMILRGCG